MSVSVNDGPRRPKRTDVGYKRPPVETQFKKGQKPPPRKAKSQSEPSVSEVFWRVLQERRRVVINGKPQWLTNAELVARRAMLEAEKGSPVLQRLLNQLLLLTDTPGEEQPELIIDPRDPEDGVLHETQLVRFDPFAGPQKRPAFRTE